MYDIIFIGSKCARYLDLKSRFPTVKLASTFEEAKKKSFTKFFWVVWPDLIIEKSFNFDYRVDLYDEDYIHVFKNGNYFDGVLLVKKTLTVSSRELSYRFFTNKKEINILASLPAPFDIVFISYFEKYADANFELLKQKMPSANIFRVNGVKGIYQAHQEAAKIATSDLFWVVDADAKLVDDFNFSFPQVVCHDTYTKQTVHVWRSRNPINGLIYGYGGVKLLPRLLTLKMDMSKPDMTTSISPQFKSLPEISNITAFNADPESTWRSAFRECCKLASRVIDGQVDSETEDRLNIWCELQEDAQYGFYAYLGALAGRAYGRKNAGNIPALSKINDFNWLQALWLEEKSQLSLEHKQ
jgi:hypothetical protein